MDLNIVTKMNEFTGFLKLFIKLDEINYIAGFIFNNRQLNQFFTSYHNIYILTVAYARVILAHARIEVKNVRKFKCRNIKRRP